MSKKPDVKELRKIAKQVRKDILAMLAEAGSGHTGGSLSSVELVTALYYYNLRHDPKNPQWEDRDIFILSKGHTCPVVYAVLANRGFFPREELKTLRKYGSRLQGHIYIGVPGVETSTGSLGQGLSIANGFSLAAKLDKKDRRTYCILGDGEIQEGQIWEAAMSSSHYKLDNLCAILDHNKLQIDGPVEEVKGLEPLRKKWEAFGWHVIEINGHDFKQIMNAYDEAERTKGKPSFIIAHTIKGKGVKFMEGLVKWHGVAPKKVELERALKELEEE